MSQENFNYLLYTWLGVALAVFISLFFVTAPYGRHTRKGWGIQVDNRLGWIIMESVSPLVFTYFFLSGSQVKSGIMWIFGFLWLFHYINRSLIFPFRTRTQGKKMPIAIVLSAVFFNSINGFINGYYLGTLSEIYPENWFYTLQFWLGLSLFGIGFFINFQADEILLNLRKPNEKNYKIPQGALYQYVSCPNYLGEIIEWTGFAILTASFPAWVFVIWTIANLLPRAIANHQWYQQNFSDYPKERKAIFPFIL